MGTIAPIQPSFSAGEISPRLRARCDKDFYREAVAKARNWVVTSQGSALMRPGVRLGFHLHEMFTPEIGDRCEVTSAKLLKTVPVAGKEGYLVALGNSTMTALSADAIVELPERATDSAGCEYLPYSFASGDNWDHSAYPIFNREPVALVGDEPARCVSMSTNDWVGKSFTLDLAGTYRFRFTLPVHLNGNGQPVPGMTAAIYMRIQIGTAQGDGTYFDVLEGGVGGDGSGLTAHVHFAFDVALPAGTHYVTFTAGNQGGEMGLTGVSLQLFGYQQTGTPWTLSELDDLYTAPYIGGLAYGFVACHREHPPHKVYIDPYGVWRCTAPTITGRPAQWGPGNWPRVCLMYQGRLWLGSTPAQPDMFWGSTINSPWDFTIPEAPTDGSALSHQLGLRQEIRWMEAYQGALVMGTEVGEVVVTSQGGVICTTDIQARYETAFGSTHRAPLRVGSQALYLSKDRRKIYALNFENARQAWQSQDLTFLAEHITKAKVDELVFARDPSSQLVALLDDGSFAFATYVPEAGVVAWRPADTGLDVLSIAVTEGTASRLWLLDDNHLLHWVTFDDSAGDHYQDGWVSRTIADRNVSSLSHLAGETVLVAPTATVGGALQAALTRVVAQDGTLTEQLPEGWGGGTGATVIVGLPIVAQLDTLGTEGGSPRGTAQGAKRHWAKVRLRLNDSAVPTVNGETPVATREGFGVDATTRRMTGDALANVLGHDDGHLHIEQTQPFRTEVLAIFGVLSVTEV